MSVQNSETWYCIEVFQLDTSCNILKLFELFADAFIFIEKSFMISNFQCNGKNEFEKTVCSNT